MIKRLLIANRGEIALRIIKTAQAMGIHCIAIYTFIDKNSLYVQQADEAILLEGITASESYLQLEKIITIAKASKADAIHPGYGFLSENAEFAKACENHQIIFIGPSSDVIFKMGNKSAAKAIMEKAKVPVVPGFYGDEQSNETLIQEGKKIGYPILIKAAFGGGGKGMRIVRNDDELETSIIAAKREAQKAFNNDKLLIEKYIDSPRHIEVQVIGDHQGTVLHLYTRDCSIQRRHQKIIEEAPATCLKPEVEKAICDTAVAAAKSLQYTNAGTIEFILDSDQNFYFMEMNTRLQVEHPVTEMITGIDLVKLQIDIANKVPFALKQSDIKVKGHAIEARIYAEDPCNNFLPATGVVTKLSWPVQNKNIRIDTSISQSDHVTIYYDPMIAKVISYGTDRNSAINKMKTALQNTTINGVKNNIGFLLSTFGNSDFQLNHISTHFVEKHLQNLLPSINKLAPEIFYLATIKWIKENKLDKTRYKNNLAKNYHLKFGINSETINLDVTQYENQFTIISANFQATVHLNQCDGNEIHLSKGQESLSAEIIIIEHKIFLSYANQTICLQERSQQDFEIAHQISDNHLLSPMPGTIIDIKVAPKSSVIQGAQLIILEAMKMEHTIKAPNSGIVEKIHFKIGDFVSEGDELITLAIE